MEEEEEVQEGNEHIGLIISMVYINRHAYHRMPQV